MFHVKYGKLFIINVKYQNCFFLCHIKSGNRQITIYIYIYI